jgi:hypothetical protein
VQKASPELPKVFCRYLLHASENDLGDASRFAKLSVLIVCISTALCSSIVFAIRDMVYSDLSTEMIILSLLLLTSLAIATLRSIIVATLKVKMLPIFYGGCNSY